MKSKCYPIIIFAIGLCFTTNSCKYNHSPESVTKKFLISFNQMDIERAKSLSTEKTWDILNIMAEATKTLPKNRKEAFASHFQVNILNVKKESDSTVIVTFKTEPKRLPFNQFRLFKTTTYTGDTRWKVDISTLDLLNSEEEQTHLTQELPTNNNKQNKKPPF